MVQISILRLQAIDLSPVRLRSFHFQRTPYRKWIFVKTTFNEINRAFICFYITIPTLRSLGSCDHKMT